MSQPDTLRAALVGACIGLACTCVTNPATDQTPGLLLAGLHASDPATEATGDQLARLIDRIHADRARVSPNCADCASPCGRTSDYDMARLDAAPPAVQAAKRTILANLQQMAHRGRMEPLVSDALTVLAEDWDAQALAWYVEETAARIG